MKHLTVLVMAVVVLVLPVIGDDLFLYSDMQFTVNSQQYYQARLHDTSRIFISSTGYIGNLNAWGFSAVDISGGSFGNLYSWDSSTVIMSSGGLLYSSLEVSDFSTATISGGSLGWINANGRSVINLSGGHINQNLYGWDSALINISGGHIDTPNPRGSSIMNMSAGSARWFSAEDSSIANISGGSIEWLYTVDSSIANITGGHIKNLHAHDMSVINVFGRNFQFENGLTLDGNRVLGTGLLSGEWLDGTCWTMNINQNYSTAIIQVIPEPCTLLLLGLGGLLIRRR